jgi:hypothetical protein
MLRRFSNKGWIDFLHFDKNISFLFYITLNYSIFISSNSFNNLLMIVALAWYVRQFGALRSAGMRRSRGLGGLGGARHDLIAAPASSQAHWRRSA